MTVFSPLGAPAPFAAYDTRNNWRLLVRDDTNGQLVNEVEDFSEATFIARFNDVGTWEFKTRLVGPATDLVRRGRASLVARVGPDTVISGPVTRAARTWDETGEEIVVNGVSDLVWTAVRVVRNTGPLPPGGDGAEVVIEGSFPWVLHWLMHHAVSGRAGPNITWESQAQGPQPYPCSVTARWEPVLGVMQRAAQQSRPVYGFDVRDLHFEHWLPRDPGVIFSAELGTMAGYELVVERPDANHVFVLGKREGADRQWRLATNDPSADYWWPVEQTRDRSDVGEEPEEPEEPEDGWPGGQPPVMPWPDNQEALRIAGLEALAELDRPVAVQVTPIDVENQQFGLHYGLGDMAHVIFPDGSEVHDIITEVTIQLSTNGPLIVRPTVGNPQMSLDTFRDLRAVERRLTLLESR
jgi:Siphovirus ReqiPepy6 Gp37-like protein